MAAAPIEMIVSRTFKYLRNIITPLVSGIVVLLIGLSLIKVGIVSCSGGYSAMDNGTFGSWENLSIAALVLLSVLFFNRCRNKYLRMSSIVIGLVIGYIAAWFMGIIDFSSIQSYGGFNLPMPFRYGLDFDLSTIIALGLIFMITAIEAYGDITANSLIKVDDTTPKDGEVAALAKKIKAGIDAAYGEVFAKTEVELNGAKDPGNRTQETNLGDLITDSMLWKIKQSAADLNIAEENIVAITNGGGIRATIKKGNITKKDVNTVLPFGNTVAVVYVTGAELLEALEASTYSTPGAIGGFPQVAGMKFTIDTTKEFDKGDLYPGSTYHQPKSIKRVSIQEINGKPFDPKATYAVVTNNFLAAGGDTYYAFASASSQFDTGLPLDEVLMEYITEELNATVTAKQYGEPQGRITVLTGSGEPKPGPKTADETDLTFYMITGVVALVGLGTCVMVRKKKEQE